MPTLAELRANRPVHRAERARTICTAPHIVAEIQALTAELDALAVEPTENDAEAGPPDRGGEAAEKRQSTERRAQRESEIQSRMRELLAEMAEHEGELRTRAADDGEWRRWVNAHPPRSKDDDHAGYVRDVEVGGGYCNADDLIDDLGMWAYSWDGEPLGEGDWAILSETISRPDKKEVARDVVAMHERMGSDLGNWRRDLSATLRRLPGAVSPALSAERPASSSDESQQSDTSTTTPTTA